MNGDKNNLDRFIDGLTQEGNKKIIYEKTYERPSKLRSVIGFVLSLIVLIILVGLFTLSVMYFVLIIVDVLLVVFYGVNTFTEKGIGLPKTIAYAVEDEEEEVVEDESYYNEEDSNSSFYDSDEYDEDERQ